MVLHTRGRVGSRRFSEEETLQAIVCKVSLHLLTLPRHLWKGDCFSLMSVGELIKVKTENYFERMSGLGVNGEG